MKAKHEEMYSPDYQRQVRYQFESFCRKVIYSERFDCLRRMLRYMEHEANFSSLPEAFLGSISRVESNTGSLCVFNVCGYSVPIQNDRLASALLEFDDMERSILSRRPGFYPRDRGCDSTPPY